MNREALERELRARLEGFTYNRSLITPGDGRGRPKRLMPHHVRFLGEHLLPWIVEKIEEANTEARLDEVHLP